MTTNDGGPAFPHTGEQVAAGMRSMTLRDYFAAAMQGIIQTTMSVGLDAMTQAKLAYHNSDAMLAAREVRA